MTGGGLPGAADAETNAAGEESVDPRLRIASRRPLANRRTSGPDPSTPADGPRA
jgi:hypothetical protein